MDCKHIKPGTLSCDQNGLPLADPGVGFAIKSMWRVLVTSLGTPIELLREDCLRTKIAPRAPSLAMSSASSADELAGSPFFARSWSTQKQRKIESIVILYTPMKDTAINHEPSAMTTTGAIIE